MEGNLITGMMLGGYLAQKNMSLEDGCSAEEMQIFLHFFCSMMISSESPELCAYFINKEYGIDEATDDFDRVMRFTHYAGKYIIHHGTYCMHTISSICIIRMYAWCIFLHDCSNRF